MKVLNLFPDYYVVENGNVSGDFTSNDFDVDGDPIIPIIESSPKKGSITSSDLGKFSYSPDLGEAGIDSFIYSVPNTTGNVSRALLSYDSEWKYLDNGTKQWTKQFGTPSSDLADGVATDSSGNVYVVGYTYGDLDGNTNTGASDIFVVKYNFSGTKQWTKQLGSSSRDYDYGVLQKPSKKNPSF